MNCIPSSSVAGIGLRQAHLQQFIDTQPKINWLEVHTENYFNSASGLTLLKKLRANYAISLHGVGLSLGSVERPNQAYLAELKLIIDAIDPLFVSDHLAFNRVDNIHLHDLLPMPFTKSVIDIFVAHIQLVQEYIQRPLLVENITRYTTLAADEMTEADFITEIAKRSGCKLLIDVTNAYVNTENVCGDHAFNFLASISPQLIQEIHLSGFSLQETTYIDSHSQLIQAPIWQLYEKLLPAWGAIPTLVEWDTELPSLDVLLNEANKINQLQQCLFTN